MSADDIIAAQLLGNGGIKLPPITYFKKSFLSVTNVEPRCVEPGFIVLFQINKTNFWVTVHLSIINLCVKDAGDKLDLEPKVEDFEAFLKKYSNVVHDNHVILVDKKYTLAKMYGRMKGFEADEMSDDQFKRKRQLCEDVLKVLDKIMPGR
jgi:hypothetical protein